MMKKFLCTKVKLSINDNTNELSQFKVIDIFKNKDIFILKIFLVKTVQTKKLSRSSFSKTSVLVKFRVEKYRPGLSTYNKTF